jgi:hypothetical protein
MTLLHVRDPRVVEVPAELLARARAALAQHGPLRGAKRMGISRNALISVVASGFAMRGTVALMKQASEERAA